LWESRVWCAAAIVGFCAGAIGADALADRYSGGVSEPVAVEANDDSLHTVDLYFGKLACGVNTPPVPGDQVTILGLLIVSGTRNIEVRTLARNLTLLKTGTVRTAVEGYPGERRDVIHTFLASPQAVEKLALAQKRGILFPEDCPPRPKDHHLGDGCILDHREIAFDD